MANHSLKQSQSRIPTTQSVAGNPIKFRELSGTKQSRLGSESGARIAGSTRATSTNFGMKWRQEGLSHGGLSQQRLPHKRQSNTESYYNLMGGARTQTATAASGLSPDRRMDQISAANINANFQKSMGRQQRVQTA